MDFLPLTHGDVRCLEVEPLAQGDDGVSGVRAHGQKADEGCAGVRFLPRPLQVQDHTLSVFLPQRVFEIFPGLGNHGNGNEEKSELVLSVLETK